MLTSGLTKQDKVEVVTDNEEKKIKVMKTLNAQDSYINIYSYECFSEWVEVYSTNIGYAAIRVFLSNLLVNL